jgi:hypothetical protein
MACIIWDAGHHGTQAFNVKLVRRTCTYAWAQFNQAGELAHEMLVARVQEADLRCL